MLNRAAEAGHPAANYNLALTLLATGRDEDLARAVACLRIAAEANILDAQHAIGILAKQGRGMPQSDAEAARWMARASAGGHVPAQIEYAIMLFNGSGVAADDDAAAKRPWRRRSKATRSRRTGSRAFTRAAAASRSIRSRPRPGTSPPAPRGSTTPSWISCWNG